MTGKCHVLQPAVGHAVAVCSEVFNCRRLQKTDPRSSQIQSSERGGRTDRHCNSLDGSRRNSMDDGRTELVKETGLILTEGRPTNKSHKVAADPHPLGIAGETGIELEVAGWMEEI